MRTGAPYQVGFQTLTTELGPTALPVAGSLPGWLNGSLLRTGPGRFEVGDESYKHWFDGLAMLCRFDIASGGVSYANRYLRSQTYNADMRKRRITRAAFATNPRKMPFNAVVTAFRRRRRSDNGNVNVIRTVDGYMALPETPFPVQFDPVTLETLDRQPDRSSLTGHLTTAHPQYDVVDNRAYNYLLKFGRSSVYQIFASDEATGSRSLLAVIPMHEPCYVHSIGASENHIVLALPPFTVNPMALVSGDKPFVEHYVWRPELGLRFFVVNKQTGRIVREAVSEARFLFHHVNAFEADNTIVADLVTYPDASVIDQLYLDRLRSGETTAVPSHLTRYRIPLDGGEVEARRLSDTAIELACINTGWCAGRAHRWVFGGGLRDGDFIDCIVKIDATSGDATVWHSPDCYPGEPVFVPAPDARGEDEGVLLSVVLDARRETSFLLVLDAETLREAGRASVPHAIPFGTHGNFFPASV